MNYGINIGIVGAGLGGMTAAVALQQRGFHNVTVFEQASQLGEIGAGITVGPNITLILAGLGLEDAAESFASATTTFGTNHYQTGERILFTERSIEQALATQGAVVRHLHRADLHKVLENAFNTEGNALRLNHTLKHIEQDAVDQEDGGVSLHFTNGATERCDVVIACDGLKSVVRDTLFDTQPPTFTGFLTWRGLVEADDVPGLDVVPHFAGYPSEGRMFARYPLRRFRQINWVANAYQPDATGEESWNDWTDVSEVLEHMGDYHPEVQRIIKASPGGRCLRWALHSRQPLDSWTAGRVVLLGDAAHPMTPFYGMGAGMAFEDAAVLARCFEADTGDWQAAFARYEKARLARANKFHVKSLERGKTYMSANPADRAKDPTDGMKREFTYNAMTVEI
ncbi:MAG: NAD(P)-binding protein [Rhodospirillaceae bacterium]|jgi:salicylate hydroxylase|nr:NAD(P)-binding protein [Rhodospirillaceae bacterium]MBT5242524.1 NAD(P)-binding protein [Rhodospirillaceae bacterium]MBT5566479.1 NAD(P)-binding protein [Rhodospirillaceae bacterium]MBT6088323.1 NAD(P)-binding protein [Rhodospirillaceae bacterium]MBT7451882.1 NAD(P)-binding protein [Rhodospirillaceae bacterium]